jgi:iron complex transport system ATP-binding protein
VTGLSFELRGVRLRYGDIDVLGGVDLRVEAGEMVCVVGPNGAGKSSLLRCVTGAVTPDDGVVLLDGAPLVEQSRATVARRVAVVPGNATLPFAMRVADVVALGRIPHEHPLRGLQRADRDAVTAAMERVGIGHLADRDARRLSLGERQLVALAMAVAQAGGLLVLDEPTVHLDLRHQVEIMALLTELRERDGMTIVAVLHDLPLAAHVFPRLVLLADGRIVADGPAEAVLTPSRISAVYGVDGRYVPLIGAAPG